MKTIHRIAKVGEKIVLNDMNKDNENAIKVLKNEIATVTELLGFTKAMTTLGIVYHAWYDVIIED